MYGYFVYICTHTHTHTLTVVVEYYLCVSSSFADFPFFPRFFLKVTAEGVFQLSVVVECHLCVPNSASSASSRCKFSSVFSTVILHSR
jgi:hypothetical protein